MSGIKSFQVRFIVYLPTLKIGKMKIQHAFSYYFVITGSHKYFLLGCHSLPTVLLTSGEFGEK